MENILKKIGKISSFASRYIGIIIIAFSCLAFFWRDGFAWMTNYTSVFLGVIMFGMGLTIRLEDFRAIFSSPKQSKAQAEKKISDPLCKTENFKFSISVTAGSRQTLIHCFLFSFRMRCG